MEGRTDRRPAGRTNEHWTDTQYMDIRIIERTDGRKGKETDEPTDEQRDNGHTDTKRAF